MLKAVLVQTTYSPHTSCSEYRGPVVWADLNEEPLVLTVPNTNGRYYVIALFDMWSNAFAYIGNRNIGTDSSSFLLVGPNWTGPTPQGFKQVYKSPTRYVWVNGQMLSSGAADYEQVNALQKQNKTKCYGQV